MTPGPCMSIFKLVDSNVLVFDSCEIQPGVYLGNMRLTVLKMLGRPRRGLHSQGLATTHSGRLAVVAGKFGSPRNVARLPRY